MANTRRSKVVLGKITYVKNPHEKEIARKIAQLIVYGRILDDNRCTVRQREVSHV